MTLDMDMGRVRRELEGEGFFRWWIYREEVSSTMDLARQHAEAGAPEGLVVIASRQSTGRGRFGRRWQSPVGGLWFSLLLRPPIKPDRSGCIAVLSAVAVAQALRESYALPIKVKWPNDLILHQRKLGGILIELSTGGESIDWLIVGVGLNVNNPLPSRVRVPPISLREALGRDVELEECLIVVLRGLAHHYRGFLREGFEPIRERWQELSVLEDRISFDRGKERFEAQVKGLSESGKLIVEHAGRLEELVAEEVTLVQ